ncbi:MAG: hypothetical protein KDA91_22080 [Planctomycetaceae bacterium]|nr:hypothetical protein [Planctomycetaceae bacterium]
MTLLRGRFNVRRQSLPLARIQGRTRYAGFHYHCPTSIALDLVCDVFRVGACLATGLLFKGQIVIPSHFVGGMQACIALVGRMIGLSW